MIIETVPAREGSNDQVIERLDRIIRGLILIHKRLGELEQKLGRGNDERETEESVRRSS
jgi:hypothetical protein